MDKTSTTKLNLSKILPFRSEKYSINKKKHHASLRCTLSKAETSNKLNQQVASYTPKNISIVSRTTSHNLTTILLKELKLADIIYDFLDLSRTSIKGIKEFFKTPGAKKWTEQYVYYLEKGKNLSMPGMAETTKKMINVINNFRVLYNKQMKPQDSDALTTLQSALDLNANNSYPTQDSELLAKKFCVLRDYLVLSYGKKGDPQWPIETGSNFSISDFGKSKKKLSTLENLSQQILSDNFLENDADTQPIYKRYPFYEPVTYDIEYFYQMNFNHANSVRILVMDDLCIEDFNQTAGLKITYLGLLQDTSIARHDNREFLSYPFLLHDGSHAYANTFFIAPKNKSIIYSVMNEYYNKLKPALNSSVAQIVEYMFFSTLHERPDFFNEEKNTKTALSLTLSGFGIIKDEHNEYDEKYLTHPLSSEHNPTTEETAMIYHLKNATNITCHAVKIYKFFSHEAILAAKNNQTSINKLVSETESENNNQAQHSIESLSQMISDDQIKRIKRVYLKPFLDKIEKPREQLFLQAKAQHEIKLQ